MELKGDIKEVSSSESYRGLAKIAAMYVCEASNQHKMMTIIVYRRLLKMKSVEDRIDQVSRQTICVISPDLRATRDRSMVSQILCPSAYDCFKLHLLSTCLSITRNHLIRIEGCCSATDGMLLYVGGGALGSDGKEWHSLDL